jgi:carboxymethylenebutenolidase
LFGDGPKRSPNEKTAIVTCQQSDVLKIEGQPMTAETIQMEWITIGTGENAADVYLVRPTTSRRLPAVIVMPTIHGVNTYIKDVAIDLAKLDFVALVVDIYSRRDHAPDLGSPEKVRAAVENLDEKAILNDIANATAYLNEHSSVQRDRVGILGFCVGGAHAIIAAAAKISAIRASVAFYGLLRNQKQHDAETPVSPVDVVPAIRVPLLFHVGDQDPWIDAEMIDEFERRMREEKKAYELCVYRGAGHAFHEHFRATYRPVAAQTAWLRSLAFLHWYLKESRMLPGSPA